MIAAFGYLGKLAVQGAYDWRSNRGKHLARMHQLRALLQASQAAFTIQRALAGRLADRLRAKYQQDVPAQPGLERLFAQMHDRFDAEEAELHSVVRAYTEHALLPINRAVADWLRADVQDRVIRGKGEHEAKLAELLNQLDAHLVLWLAKYESWIPNRPDHALVYLADEQLHGLGFPQGLDDALSYVLVGKPSPPRP